MKDLRQSHIVINNMGQLLHPVLLTLSYLGSRCALFRSHFNLCYFCLYLLRLRLLEELLFFICLWSLSLLLHHSIGYLFFCWRTSYFLSLHELFNRVLCVIPCFSFLGFRTLQNRPNSRYLFSLDGWFLNVWLVQILDGWVKVLPTKLVCLLLLDLLALNEHKLSV